MAWIDFGEDACIVDKRTESDGMGGVTVSWTDGASIKACFVRESTTEAKIAYQNGIREIFTIVFSDLLELAPNDRVKRLSDGKVFRITSDARDMTTPKQSDMHFQEADAEVVTA